MIKFDYLTRNTVNYDAFTSLTYFDSKILQFMQCETFAVHKCISIDYNMSSEHATYISSGDVQ